ncbi:AsnC family transcriptional regulator [Gordonia sp. PP30]|uniref:AsnC family transcriptional regulator n=1 Tax=Gordonia sp. PP30 TaxID=2935861 RepID=UPI001FFEA18E|nr:AsnC family transcriptional regulator [Gordonia sp. PP30]UQE74565.1 AsnC family transcriptional regulator [Gordonia sp. PP30]
MDSDFTQDSPFPDAIDRRIAQALQVRPRASFSELGDVLGLAEQTVARRYRRLRREGLLRVTMVYEPTAANSTSWQIRVHCRPEGAASIAEALSRRQDVSWVVIQNAGSEVSFGLRATDDAHADELLGRLLPKAAPVLDVSAYQVLHVFAGGSTGDFWKGWIDEPLTPTQVCALRDADDLPVPDGSPARPLTAADRRLVAELARDGRTSFASLARSTGMSVGRVTRRFEALLRSGAVYLDVDIAPALSGTGTAATFWMTVRPDRLTAVGEALAAHPAVPFSAAITGSANLVATIITPNQGGIYAFLTRTLGPIDGITGYELVPHWRRVKYASALTVGDRLAPPAPLP